jgi:hypothetical protein
MLPLIRRVASECSKNARGFPYSRSALNAAVVAWESRQMEASRYVERLSLYVGNAVYYLNSAIELGVVDTQSIFTSHLLAWIAYSTCSQEIFAHVHFKGSLAFLSFVMDKLQSRAKPLPEILIIYGPFIIDCANAWTTRHGTIPRRYTNFSQRVKYFDDLRSSDQSDSWHPGLLEAANSTLGNLMEVALTWTYNIAMREATFNFSRDNVHDILQYIRSELGDIDLRSGLSKLYRAFQGTHTNHTTVEGQLITRVFHRLRCILLLLTLLEADSIEGGISTSKANFIAKSAVCYCRTQAIEHEDPIEDHYLTSWHNFSHLLIGGVALPVQECSECKSHPWFIADIVRAWVIKELEFVGKDECARTLERYWMYKNADDLAQIMQFAQFPEPMADN